MIKFNNGSYEPQNTREVVLGLIKEFQALILMKLGRETFAGINQELLKTY